MKNISNYCQYNRMIPFQLFCIFNENGSTRRQQTKQKYAHEKMVIFCAIQIISVSLVILVMKKRFHFINAKVFQYIFKIFYAF